MATIAILPQRRTLEAPATYSAFSVSCPDRLVTLQANSFEEAAVAFLETGAENETGVVTVVVVDKATAEERTFDLDVD